MGTFNRFMGGRSVVCSTWELDDPRGSLELWGIGIAKEEPGPAAEIWQFNALAESGNGKRG